MFSIFKPQRAPEGPVGFAFSVDIDRPVEDVYSLLDWADPRNAKRQLGERVSAVEGESDRFELMLGGLAGYVFEITVTEAAPHSVYAFSSAISPRLGQLETSHERYLIERLEGGAARIVLETTALFAPGLRMKTYQQEVATMSLACHNALAKLKLHAERGVSAVRAADDQMVVIA